jgi:hypothetical protein
VLASESSSDGKLYPTIMTRYSRFLARDVTTQNSHPSCQKCIGFHTNHGTTVSAVDGSGEIALVRSELDNLRRPVQAIF